MFYFFSKYEILYLTIFFLKYFSKIHIYEEILKITLDEVIKTNENIIENKNYVDVKYDTKRMREKQGHNMDNMPSINQITKINNIDEMPSTHQITQINNVDNIIIDKIPSTNQITLTTQDTIYTICNLANIQRSLGFYIRAEKWFKLAIQIYPNFIYVRERYANLLHEMKCVQQAKLMLESVLDIEPYRLGTMLQLGNLLTSTNQLAKAETVFRDVIRIHNFIGGFVNLGNVLRKRKDFKNSMLAYDGALQIDPNNGFVHNNKGTLLRDLGFIQEAEFSFLQAVKLNPKFINAYVNLGSLYIDMKRFNCAIKFCRKAILLDPNHSLCIANLANSYQHICDWTSLELLMPRVLEVTKKSILNGETPTINPHLSLSLDFTPELRLEIANLYAKRAHVDAYNETSNRIVSKNSVSTTTSKERRWRIGYISSDFADHPLAHLTVNLFAYHDKTKFEIFCYALTKSDESRWRRQIEKSLHHFVYIGHLSYQKAAQEIKNDNIDILINLNGYTFGNRNEIFAMKPATFQCNYMGFPASFGGDYIDFIVTDRITSPEELSHLYTETLLYMYILFIFNFLSIFFFYKNFVPNDFFLKYFS
eukprot:GSMAST32.ASY1.ANO1.1038.1 assembled CDS